MVFQAGFREFLREIFQYTPGPVVDSAVFRDLLGRTRLAELRQERCRQIRSEVLEVDSRPSDWMGDVQIQNLALGCLEESQ